MLERAMMWIRIHLIVFDMVSVEILLYYFIIFVFCFDAKKKKKRIIYC